MAKRLFVGGLPFATTDTELSEIFTKAGKVVSATVVMDRMTNRSKGFGFVEMSTEEEAKKAIEEINNTKVGDRTIVVKEAYPPKNQG